MPESGAFGSARGVSGNGHPYRNPRPVRDIATGTRGTGTAPAPTVKTVGRQCDIVHFTRQPSHRGAARQ